MRISDWSSDVCSSDLRESLSHQKVPKIAAPTYKSWGELLTFLGKENLPGSYPYTGGVYPYRRTGEDPIRMFAGEGTPSPQRGRSEERRVGQEWVSTCRSRGSPLHKKKNNKKKQ